MPSPRDTPAAWPGTAIGALSCAILFLAGTSLSWLHARWLSSAEPRGRVVQPYRQRAWRTVDGLPQRLAQFDTVFWEPRDTDSLRQLIARSVWLRGKTVLEIGTGTGLVSLYCLGAGAKRVVATDINPAAIANAQFNANHFGVSDRFEARLVPASRSSAFSVVWSHERFDLIVSNPPWEDGQPRSIDEFALYDPGFKLLHSLLANGQRYLNPGGRLWLAYGCTEAIREIQKLAPHYGWQVRWLDDRRLADLPPVFLPGLLLELVPVGP